MQQLFNYIYRFRVGLLLLWCSYLILLSFFYPMGGDETGYYYSARLFSRGEIPILDFFAIQPLGFFIPYAAIARWFSPSFEAMRLISLFSCIAVPLLITLLVNRYYGRTLAIYAFLIIAFSHWYFYWNIQIIHYSISNLSLFTSFFILFYFRPRVFLFFLAGFTMGWAINARLSLGPTGAVLFILIMTHIGQVQEVSWKERFLKRGLPFVFGGVLASLPTLAILIADSEAFLFNLLQARMKFRDDSITTILNPENLDFFQSFLKRRLAVIYHFFFWANSLPKSMIQNSFLLVVTSMIALIFFKRSKEERKTWRRAIFQDTFISYLFWLGLVIFLSHFFTVMPTGYYVQYLFPIMTIILLGILFHGGIHSITPSIRDFDGWVFRTMAIFLVPYMFYHLAFSGINLIRRNTPNLGRLVTIAHVGCWIEQNSKENEALLGWVGTPIVATGRRLPQGFEYHAAVVPLFWRYNVDPVDPKIAQRFKLYLPQDFANDIKIGSYRILVMEYQFADEVKRYGIEEDLKKNYRLFATTGGGEAFKQRRYDIYLRNDLRDDDFTKMPLMAQIKPLERLVRVLQGKMAIGPSGIWGVVENVFTDVLDSVARLPVDIGLAWARVSQAPYEKRCSQYIR